MGSIHRVGTLLRKSKVVRAKKFGDLVSKLGGDTFKMRVYLAFCNGALLLAWSATAAAQPTQKQAASGATAGAAHPAGVQGEWEGDLVVGEARMKLVLHVSGEKSGELRARLDSPEQSVYGMEASAVSQALGTLRFEIASVGASFEGKLGADGRSLTGAWKQAGQSFPLVFHRQSGNAAGKKPMDAISQLEGTWQGAFQNGNMRYRLQLHVTHDEEKKLSGTLDSLDQGANGLPMSELSERNGAVHFEIAMVAGVYEGTMNAAHNAIAGKWSQNQDTVALQFKRSDEVLALRRPQNPTKPYPYKEEEVSFQNASGRATLAGTLTMPQGNGPFPAVLLVAGSGPPQRDEFLVRARAIAEAAGMPIAQVAQSLDVDRKAYAMVREEGDAAVLEKKLDAMVISSGMAEGSMPASVQAQIHMLSSPWFRNFLDYDPLPALKKVKCPALVLNGSKDLQVSAAENLPLIQRALEEAGDQEVTVKEMPDLNHLLQRAESGTPAEYGAIEETISAEVLQLICDWATKHSGL